jgi:hypothetical protein
MSETASVREMAMVWGLLVAASASIWMFALLLHR